MTDGAKPLVLRFKVDDFERKFFHLLICRDDAKDRIYSDEVTDIRGNKWKVGLRVGAAVSGSDNIGSNDDVMVIFYLVNLGQRDVSAQLTFILRDSLGKVCRQNTFTNMRGDEHGIIRYDPFLFKASGGRYGGEWIKLSELINKEDAVLCDGALLVDALLQFRPEPDSFHVPSNPLTKNILKVLQSGEGSDVSFKVGDTIIPAHRFILQVNAPMLAEFCKGSDPNVPVAVEDVTSETFQVVLRYIYGGEGVSDNEMLLSMGKEIIEASNRFGICGLKLATEASLVQCISINIEDVADWLLFADAMTCPLLKEYSLSYAAARASDLLPDTEWSHKLNQSPKLMAELVLEISNSANNDTRLDAQRNATVDELRKKLDEKGLDVDGSKDMLLSRLEESNKRQRTE